MTPSVPPPSYVTVLPASIPPPPYTPPSTLIPSTVFYALQPAQAPTYTILRPSPTIQVLPPQLQFLSFPPFIPNNTIFFFPPFIPTNSNTPRIFQGPVPFPPRYIPGQVPSWVPREIRYELYRGVLTPVEHFVGSTTPIAFAGRGWNTIHGYDTGPLPPGFTSGASTGNLPDMGRSLSHIAVSTTGEPGAHGLNEGGTSTGGVGAGGGDAEASGTVGVENAGEGSGTLSTESEREDGASRPAESITENSKTAEISSGGGGYEKSAGEKSECR